MGGVPLPSPRIPARFWRTYAGSGEADELTPEPLFPSWMPSSQPPADCGSWQQSYNHGSLPPSLDRVSLQPSFEPGITLPSAGRSGHAFKKEVQPKYLLMALLPFHGHRARTQAQGSLCSVATQQRWLMEASEPARSRTPEFAERVLESPTSVTILTEQGPVKVPPRFWLVVEHWHEEPLLPALASGIEMALVDEGDEPLPPPLAEPRVSLLLSLRAGGGRIAEESASSLRVVSEQRIHAAAAEANFQRASRNGSIVALRHAARILELVEERGEATQLGTVASARLGDRLSDAATAVTLPPTVRLQRMKGLVEGFAAAAVKRAESPPASARASRALMPPVERGNRSRVLLHKGVMALEEFLEFVNRHYGNPVRAWFNLDVEENMKIGEKQFMRRALEIGFRGNIPALWKYLDSEHTGTASLSEIDIGSAMALAAFKEFIHQTFHNSAEEMFRAVDRNRSGKLIKSDFVVNLPALGYQHSAARLFDLLDRQGMGFVMLRDVEFLNKWKPHHYLYCQPDVDAFNRFREALLETYGEPMFRVWHKVLDRDGSMRISWDEFKCACITMLKSPQTAAVNIPKTEVEMARVWRAMDKDCSGWISLREFDPEAYQALGSFRIWTHKHHGSVVQLFRILDDNGNGKVSLSELNAIKKGSDGFQGNVNMVFSCLDVNGERLLQDHEVKFLDTWDVWWEEYEMGLRKRLCWNEFKRRKAVVPSPIPG